MSTHPPTEAPPPPAPPFVGSSRRQWLALDSLIALVGAAVSIVDLRFTPHGGQIAVFVLAALAYFLIPARRRRPLVVLGAATVVVVLIAARGGTSAAPLGLMLGLAGYSVAAQLPRRQSIRATLASATLVAAALIYATASDLHSAIAAGTVEDLVPLAAAWFIGDSVATRRRYVAGLAAQAEQERLAEIERARQAVREERVRIARELHDVIAHSLAVITVQAGVGRRLMDKRPEEAAGALESIEATGRTAQDELRVVLALLRDEVPVTADLEPAPGLSDLGRLAETVRAAGTPVDLSVSGDEQALSPALELSIYRITQEALTNVVKHAPGARATVKLTVRDDEVRIHVSDNGGARPAKAAPAIAAPPADVSSQHGIVGMRERVGAFGGSLVAEPLTAGRGFRVLARIPLQTGV